MSVPGTDLYEIQKEYREIRQAVGAFGRLLMTPTKDDTSIHPTVRGLLTGHADSLAGVVKNMGDCLIGTKVEKALF